jgi:hypothetical protein
MPELKIESDFILSGDATQDDIRDMIAAIRDNKFSHLKEEWAFSRNILEINGRFPMKVHSIAHLRIAAEKAGLKVKLVVYQE